MTCVSVCTYVCVCVVETRTLDVTKFRSEEKQ